MLKLYVAGNSPAVKKATLELQTILRNEFGTHYDLVVIDILKHPQLAEKDKIMAAPTLLKLLPPPARKIIGDLTNKEKVLLGLDLYHPKG